MGFPIKTCVVCEEEFELRPNHPGYANRCIECNAPKEEKAAEPESMTADERRVQREADAERRRVIREMLYSKK
ncbi:hypothetical protein SAMN05421819_1427 [Bryocella elongata]|uniref:Uncharacterized protein n=1 Tax=Bryocella elongata TaxID=863522 RepID=A0A1H5W3W0_9BACT|nr:hypothetical protein [Bryocella elongata]SEF94063.1 hypothetical protein SAMN05421819_1427 [Bryocella elongata]